MTTASKHVITILVESAGIYSLWMITVLGFVIAAHPLYITFYDISTELYGVSTMLISVRVGLGWATGDSSRTMDAESESTRVSAWRPPTVPGGGRAREPKRRQYSVESLATK